MIVFIVTIAVGIQDRPEAAPQTGPWSSDYKIVNSPSFAKGIAAICQLTFAFTGTPFFFPIVCEMRDPRHYTKALTICQSVVTVTYIVIGVVVYYYCGSYVSSPALGSAGHLIKQIAYGIALPALFVTSTISTHVGHIHSIPFLLSQRPYPVAAPSNERQMASKYFFIRIMRGSRHLAANTPVHWLTWLSCVGAVIAVAYIIASAIPIFGSLISLVGALLGTLQVFQPAGFMWLYDNWSKGSADRGQRSAKWMFMVGFSVFMVVLGTFLMAAGTYGAVVGIIDGLKAHGADGPWSCADNSS